MNVHKTVESTQAYHSANFFLSNWGTDKTFIVNRFKILWVAFPWHWFGSSIICRDSCKVHVDETVAESQAGSIHYKLHSHTKHDMIYSVGATC